MLRLAFDFIITWRETRTRPNAYRGIGQTHYIFYYILVCNFLTILLVINILSFANVDYFPYLYKIY